MFFPNAIYMACADVSLRNSRTARVHAVTFRNRMEWIARFA